MMHRSKYVRPVVVLLAIVVACGAAAHAYSVTSYKWGYTPVVVYVNPANSDVSASAAEAAVNAGMNVWNTQSGSSFQFQYGGRVTVTTTGNDGRNVVMFRNATNGSTVASTYSWWSGGVRVDSDIVFWDAGFKFFTGTSGCSSGVYIEDFATHELGHALGLGHSSLDTATMYPSTTWCSQNWRTLSSDDIAGVRSLYPASSSTTQVPAAPSGLAVAVGSTSSLMLTWLDNAGNEGGYRVERSRDGASFSVVTNVGANVKSYLDGGLTSGTRYYYRVAAYNSAGSSAYSNTGSAVTAVETTTNTAPSVSITSPANGASYASGTTVAFSGTASDTQDGTISSRLVWTSSIDGQIGSGASFSRALSAGSHTITAKATDSGGLSGTRQVSVTVTSTTTTSGSTGPKLSAKGYKVKGNARVDLSWGGLSSTSIDVYRDNAKVAATANDGAYTDPINKKGGGSYTYKVCASGTSTCSNQVSVSF